MKLFLRFICILICAATILFLPSCGAKERVASLDVVSSLAEGEVALPSGQIYSSTAIEGEEGYISDELLCALYGEGRMPPEREEWIEFSFFLSNAEHPCELAVFLCSSPDSASDTARLLCSRIDNVGKIWAHDAQYSGYIENASVTVIKNYVVMCISSDGAYAQKIAKRLIK